MLRVTQIGNVNRFNPDQMPRLNPDQIINYEADTLKKKIL